MAETHRYVFSGYYNGNIVEMMMRCLLHSTAIVALIAIPLVASGQDSKLPLPANAQRAVLACEFTSDGFTVALYDDNTGEGIDGNVPEAGERCLPLLASIVPFPFWPEQEVPPVQAASLADEEVLVYTLSRWGRVVYVVGCQLDGGQLLVTSLSFSEALASGNDELLGQPCPNAVGQLVAHQGLRVSRPVAANFAAGCGQGGGMFWLFRGTSNGLAETKVLRCAVNQATAKLEVCSLERSGDDSPDVSVVGMPCLDVLDIEKGLPNASGKPKVSGTLIFFDFDEPFF